MAKELPYYQFEVAEYLAGDIMTCSLEAQGLFSIIKCLYWQKQCQLNTKQILKRYDKEELLDELVDEVAIKIDSDGDLSITFLDIQYQSFKERRVKLSEAGRKGGSSKREATLKPPLSEVKATPKHIEENREEENREEDISQQFPKELIEFSEKFYNALEKYGDIKKRPKTISKKNMNDLRLLHTSDGFSFDEITEIAGFYFNVGRDRSEAPFVIQSLTSLRKKANSLQAAIRNHKE